MLLLWYHNNISIFLFKTDLQMEQMTDTYMHIAGDSNLSMNPITILSEQHKFITDI